MGPSSVVLVSWISPNAPRESHRSRRPSMPGLVEHVAHVECDQLVRAEPRAERHRQDDMITPSRAMLTGHTQQRLLLGLREGARSATDRPDSNALEN